MTRRTFVIATAGVSATAASTIVGSAGPDERALIELRTYMGCSRGLRTALESAFALGGLDVRLTRNEGSSLTYEIAYAHLEERAQVWNRVNTLPEWAAAATRFRSYRFVLSDQRL